MGKTVKIGSISIGSGHGLVLISGPCVIEDEKMSLETAVKIKEITGKLGMPYIFKSSYDKGNRTSVDYYRGPGLKKGLKILERVRKETGVPVISDVQCTTEIAAAAEVLDIIQIPAYLCQQVDLVVGAGKTGKPVNVKKGQFLAPWDMKKICAKIESTGNTDIMLTERGSIFGYNNLVCDMRSIPLMQETGYPVIADITHILRIPGPASSEAAGGQPRFIPPLAGAAAAAGCDALFLEVHPEPSKALCDASSMLKLDMLEEVLARTLEISRIARK